MSKIKYVSSSGLTHYDEKIKKVIDEVDTSTNTKVTQTPTSTDASYPLLLSPSGQTQETNTTSYFNSGVVLNPSTKTISANIDGNAETATKATSADKLNTNAGSATQPTYFADGIPKACTYTLEKSVPADAVFTDTKYTDQIGMTTLGFTKNATYTVHEFFTAIYKKGYSGKISLRFRYDSSSTAKISDGTTTIDMSGVDCYLSVYSDVNSTWKKNYALLSVQKKLYLLYCIHDGDATKPSSQGIVDVTTMKAVQDGNGNVIADTYAEKETIALKSATGASISIADSKEAPMILNYAPVNLFSHTFATTTINGITFTANADGTITANGTATAYTEVLIGKYTFTENDIGKTFSWSDNGAIKPIDWNAYMFMNRVNGVDGWKQPYTFIVEKAHTAEIRIYVASGKVVEDIIYRPMLEEGSTYHTYVPYTGYDITASNDEASKSTSVTINSETVFPVSGLESYDGLTNVLNPYSANMQVTYATNEAGQGVLKEIETKAETNGSNASGNWNINITGNSKTATKATSADSATKATQDGDGNVITDTYLPVSGGTIKGSLNVNGTSKVNGITTRKTYKNDNNGWATYFLLFDITDWYLNGRGTKIGFNGFVYSSRTEGYLGEDIATIIMDVSHRKSTTVTTGNDCLALATNNGSYRPCIIHDTANDKYFLSLKITGSARDLILNGVVNGTLSTTQINATDTSGTLPTGYEFLIDPADCKLLTTSPRAGGLNIYGTEPIKSISDDTYKNWLKLPGCSVSWYNTNGHINGQPSRYGFLLNISDGIGDVHQLWFEQVGNMYRRAGNYNGLTDWYEMLDSGNYSDYAAKSSIYGDTVVSMGRKADTTVGTNSFAFGNNVTASGYYSHAEGNSTTASESCSHAEGTCTTASGIFSHAEGSETTASGIYSHAEGNSTTALKNQHAQGHYNNTTNATANSTSGTSDGTAFVIGNGISSSKSNAFRVTGKGVIYATNATVQTGADYAEYFEWVDGNPNKEDRVGYFVTFDEDNPEKIRIANEDDYILGIVSGMPNIIGNGDECWKQRYILDDFGRYIEETFEYEAEVPEVVEKEVEDEETGETKIVEEVVINKETKIGTKWKENPEYDPTQPYIPRDKRAEWNAVGMLGVLSVYDDGTCQVNGYCKCTDGGIATACEKGEGYRVIKRISDNIIKVVLK